jgi:histidinol dehydrogenase
MKRLTYSSPRFFATLDRFGRSATVSPKLEAAVRSIIADVEKRGDKAVSELIATFDKATLRPADFRLSPEKLREASRWLPRDQKQAIRESIQAVKAFARQAAPRSWKTKNLHGATVGENFFPFGRVGIYVPGGRVPLVSTVVMTATLAKVAGVPEIAVFTPSNSEGEVAPEILAALDLVGVEEVYRIGGVQAVAAMALGTRTVKAVDKVFGPGNAYVVEAKRQLFGRVGIDLLPGPSEVMVIAGEEANPAFVAADLLAQAEHGPNGRIYLVAFSKRMLDQVESQMVEQAKCLTHTDALREAFKKGYAGVEVSKVEEAIEVANFVAPEHLELHLSGPQRAACISKITTAGSILAGHFTPTVLGDFVAGPSHVLPTGRSGRFSSGLRVGDFFRKSSFVEYNPSSLKKALPALEVFSRMEELDAHGRSASIRFEA